jgi:hypothetical protein
MLLVHVYIQYLGHESIRVEHSRRESWSRKGASAPATVHHDHDHGLRDPGELVEWSTGGQRRREARSATCVAALLSWRPGPVRDRHVLRKFHFSIYLAVL